MKSWQPYQNCKSAVDQASEFSMTSGTRLAHTFYTIKELDKQHIQGDIVECGVWKGGQIIVSWLANTNTNRNFWLYDTFGGMTQPTDADYKINKDGTVAKQAVQEARDHIAGLVDATRNEIVFTSGATESDNLAILGLKIEEVEQNLYKFSMPPAKINFIKGDVCRTLNDTTNIPNKIAFLRLDTDWYESTLKELQVLWPRVVPGGYMVLDDYHSWQGSKQAFHEVLGPSVNISIIDETSVYIRKDQ